MIDQLHVIAAVIGVGISAAIAVARRKSLAKRGGANGPFTPPNHPVIEANRNTVMMPQGSQIDAVRALMGLPPRTFDSSLKSYLKVEPPVWLKSRRKDEMWENIRAQEKLRREGLVVWGTIVQANNNLFKQNNLESGASVIYSPDPWFDRNRESLRDIARQCYALKGTDPSDLESAAFARMLTNELTRAMGLRVPQVLSRGRNVFHSSMLIPRKHLPRGILKGFLFPVWIDPHEIGAVVMVPAAYWPASLTQEWDV